MKKLLIQFALWLLCRLGQQVLVCDAELVKEAKELCDWAGEMFPGASGEALRHQVYARLIKSHPDRQRRELAKAIESCL